MEKVRKQNKIEHVINDLTALYFDGKKSTHKTKIIAEDGSINHKNFIHESLVLVQEPNSKFIGSIIPESGGAEHITEAIIRTSYSHTIRNALVYSSLAAGKSEKFSFTWL